MARQRQQGKSRARNQGIDADTQEAPATDAHASLGSFADALDATQQHTVPVLPAYDAPRAFATEPEPPDPPTAARPRASASPRMSYARATLAPKASGIRPTGSHPAAFATTNESTTPQPTVRHATARRATLNPAPNTPDGQAARNGTSGQLSTGSWPDARSTPDLHSAGTRRADPPAYAEDMADAEPDDDELALTQGRPTFVLPAITGDRLPALQPLPGERQLVVREEEQQQTVFIKGASKLPTPHIALAPRRRGPRPFIVQFLVAMVTVMTLFAVLTLASPLGKGLAFSNGFQAYANAMPWVPTPTPTPKPTPVPQYYGQQQGVNPGQQTIINTIKAVFGPYSAGALNIARCESGYDPNAYNPYAIIGSHAEGVFQILYPSTWSGTSYARYSPYDYNANIHAAYEIFHNDGNSWREWECRP